MKTLRSLLVLAAAIYLQAAALHLHAAEVFCCSDTYVFKPDGTVVEFDGAAPGKLAEQNVIFSKSRSSICLAGARNEVVAFQVVVLGEAKNIAPSITALKGPGEIALSDAAFSIVAFVQCSGGIQPDLCVPLSLCKGQFSVPYDLKGLAEVPGQKAGVLLVEVRIPADAKAGEYSGKLKLSGGVESEFNLKLTVWDFAIPAQPTVVFDVNSYGSPLKDLQMDAPTGYKSAPKAVIDAEHEFYRMFNRHRMYLNILPYHSQRGHPTYAPALNGDGANTKVDWKNWEERFGPVLSGEIFDDKTPPPYFYLPFNLHWPYGYSHDEKLDDKRIDFRKNPKDYRASLVPAYEETFAAVAKQFVDHFAEKNYKNTVFQVYLNHTAADAKTHSNSAWRLDEPYDKYGFAVLQWYAKLTNQHMRDNDKGVRVGFRVDIGHWNCRHHGVQCYKPKQWEPDKGEEMLEPHIDHWYIGAVHSYGAKDKIPALLAKGPHKQAFIYGGGGTIGGKSTSARSLLWYLYDTKNRGFCTWKIGVTDPAGDPKHSGGDSVCYSSKALGGTSPLSSLRMKLWRRGSYDVEYLAQANAKNEAKVKALVAEMCPYRKDPTNKYTAVDFPTPLNNPEDWEVARHELASLIQGKTLPKELQRTGPIKGAPEKFVDQITNY
jgi:hypothetical protein